VFPREEGRLNPRSAVGALKRAITRIDYRGGRQMRCRRSALKRALVDEGNWALLGTFGVIVFERGERSAVGRWGS
jgi:hypothetical protein